MADPILVAKGEIELFLLPQMANRHGLIAGATGTGKTVSLQVLAEGLSRAGVSVFMADVKGDLAGMSQAGTDANKNVLERRDLLKLKDFSFESYPVAFWDIFGEQGHSVRATITEMGPLILSRLFDLNETQSGVLSLVFKIADDNDMDLLDLKDLQAMLQYVGNNAIQFQTQYGNVTGATIGAIQRGLLTVQEQGAGSFFGEPALDINDLMRTDAMGRGMINILAADKLMSSPKAYTAFLLWLLSELFERMPEVGDAEKPKLAFFFDEAHLLFTDAPKAQLEKIEQMVRLIRSKGVGVYFVTQNPMDVPQTVLGQLGNRIQHALRAFTPLDQKAVKSAAQTFRTNPKVDVEEVITQLGVGEALVSMLDAKGMPGIVQRAFMLPPRSQIGPIATEIRQQIIRSSALFSKYENVLDRESAYEKLQARTAAATAAPGSVPLTPSGRRKKPEPTAFEAITKNTMVRQVARTAVREVARGLMGVLLGRRR
ncbi:MAG TPA: helicase HerA-like domain-containing protein [Anaerolineales bacterium]|nr:helicase HerA-like domain-containing protein [Anaerolineales bacterium]